MSVQQGEHETSRSAWRLSAVVMLVICGPAPCGAVPRPAAGALRARGRRTTPAISPRIPSVFVTPPGDLIFHTSASAATAARYPSHLSEYLAYLGWPLLAVLGDRSGLSWRDPPVRISGRDLRGARIAQPRRKLPLHRPVPALALAAGPAGAQRADTGPARDSRRRRGRGPARVRAGPGAPGGRAGDSRAGAVAALATAAAVLAVLPLVPLPFRATPLTSVPAGWQAAFARLRLAPGARVLVRAHPGQPTSPRPCTGRRIPASRHADRRVLPRAGRGREYQGQPRAGQGRRPVPGSALGREGGRTPYGPRRRSAPTWRTGVRAAVVEVIRRRSRLGPILARLFGRPSFRTGKVAVWRL